MKVIVSFHFLSLFFHESEDDRWSSLPRPRIAAEPVIANTSEAANEQNFMHLYAQPSTSRQFHTNGAEALKTFGTSAGNVSAAVNKPPKISQIEDDDTSFMHQPLSSSQESNISHSDHSGGSEATLPLDDDDPIDYADA